MGYSGNGFFNNRSNTWVSAEHAAQHVGETVNGWEKRKSNTTGNFYMALASGDSSFERILLASHFLNEPAHHELEKMADDISLVKELSEEIDARNDKSLGGHDASHIWTKEGMSLMEEARDLFGPFNPDVLDDALETIENAKFLGLDLSPDQTLAKVRLQISLEQVGLERLKSYIEQRTGYSIFHLLKPEAYRNMKEVAKKYGIPLPSWNKPSNAYEEGRYLVGSDIPAGEYRFEQEDSWFPYSIIRVTRDRSGNDTIHSDFFKNAYYVTVEAGQYLHVSTAYFFEAGNYSPESVSHQVFEGMSKVGRDISAGKYRLEAFDDHGYWCIYNSSDAGKKIKSSNRFEGSENVTVQKGQYLLLSGCEGKLS